VGDVVAGPRHAAALELEAHQAALEPRVAAARDGLGPDEAPRFELHEAPEARLEG